MYASDEIFHFSNHIMEILESKTRHSIILQFPIHRGQTEKRKIQYSTSLHVTKNFRLNSSYNVCICRLIDNLLRMLLMSLR